MAGSEGSPGASEALAGGLASEAQAPGLRRGGKKGGREARRGRGAGVCAPLPKRPGGVWPGPALVPPLVRRSPMWQPRLICLGMARHHPHPHPHLGPDLWQAARARGGRTFGGTASRPTPAAGSLAAATPEERGREGRATWVKGRPGEEGPA